MSAVTQLKNFAEKWAKPMITMGSLVAMIFAGLVWWNDSSLPRWAWKSEINSIHSNSLQTQIDFYIRAKRSDERVLFDLDNEIDKLKQQNKTVPETAVQQRMRIQEDIDHSKQRLDDAKAKMKQQQ